MQTFGTALAALAVLASLASPASVRAQSAPSPGQPSQPACPRVNDEPPCDANRAERKGGGGDGPLVILGVLVAGGLALLAPSGRPRRPVATRLFTPPDYALPRGYGAVAVVAFPRAPSSPEERGRYVRVCRAYLTVLPDASRMARADPTRDQMITLWPRVDIADPLPLRSPPPGPQLDGACEAAVDHYAYEAAERWLARIPQRAGYDPGGRGPVLVAWAPPASAGDPRAPMLIYDLSRLDRPGAMADGFGVWKREIEEKPEIWRNGWKLTRLRLNLRALTDQYGEQIVSAVKLVPGLPGE